MVGASIREDEGNYMKAYIAGPMHDYMDKQEYRIKIREVLNKLGIEYVDPLELDLELIGKKETKRLAAIGKYSKVTEQDKIEIRKDIMERDLKVIDDCDLMIAYTPFPSWGTAMEIFYNSYVNCKLTIVITNDLNSWLVALSDICIKSIDELEDVLKRVLQAYKDGTLQELVGT
jgi:nucleoside 2-deoxyribosyltransferase